MDYSIHLQFTKHKTEQLIDVVKYIKEYIKEIYLKMGLYLKWLINILKCSNILSSYHNTMRHGRGVAHISHASRPMGGMIINLKYLVIM